MKNLINKSWQAIEDANTLERYQEIINDKKRMNSALKMAKRQAEEYQSRVDKLNKVVRKRNK